MASYMTTNAIAKMARQRRAGGVQMMGPDELHLLGPRYGSTLQLMGALPQLLGPEDVQLLGPEAVRLMGPLPQMLGEIDPEEALQSTLSMQKWSLALQTITTLALGAVAVVSLWKIAKD